MSSKKYKNALTKEGLERCVHQALERGRRVCESERHDEERKVAVVCSERGLLNVIRMHAHLMVVGAEIQFGEESSAVQLVDEFLNNRNLGTCPSPCACSSPDSRRKTSMNHQAS
jgi:hypothetical protein